MKQTSSLASAVGKVKLSSAREALFALTTCCYMARIRNSGSTSAAQALVGRSLAIGISLSMRDVSRQPEVEVFSGAKFGAKSLLRVSGDWRNGELESVLRRRTCK